MMTKEGSTKFINFMIPTAGVLFLGCGHISHIVKIPYSYKNLKLKMHYFCKKNSPLLPGIDQIIVYCNDNQGRVYRNFNFHDSRGRGSYASVWPYKSYSKITLFL